MKKLAPALVLCLFVLGGCVKTGISAADAKDAYGPQPTPQQLEKDLKAAGQWEEYEKIKARDAAVEAANRANADPGLKQDGNNIQVP